MVSINVFLMKIESYRLIREYLHILLDYGPTLNIKFAFSEGLNLRLFDFKTGFHEMKRTYHNIFVGQHGIVYSYILYL